MNDEQMMVMNLEHEPECLAMLHELGCGEKAFMRDRRRGVRHLVSEIYSPPRVTKVLSSMPGHLLTPGFALDLTCTDPIDGRPWDFDDPKKRARARELLRAQKPLFLIGSPMCKAWSTWQSLNALKRAWRGSSFERRSTSSSCSSCTRSKSTAADSSCMNTLEEPRHGRRTGSSRC